MPPPPPQSVVFRSVLMLVRDGACRLRIIGRAHQYGQGLGPTRPIENDTPEKWHTFADLSSSHRQSVTGVYVSRAHSHCPLPFYVSFQIERYGTSHLFAGKSLTTCWATKTARCQRSQLQRSDVPPRVSLLLGWRSRGHPGPKKS